MGARCAIVGSGLVSFVAYVTLRHGGLQPDEITVFGDSPDPAAVWRRRAQSIRQQFMRSESDGHCLATSFPGLAVSAAVRTRRPWPLLRSACNRYHPTVDEFLDHAASVRERSGWDESFRRARVDRVVAIDDGFAIDDHGAFPNVLVAPGHPGLSFPSELADDPRVVHAYEPHEYAESVTVVGAGMAAATEWLNALSAGASVVSVRRREPVRRPLNVPRPLFSRRGLAVFHATPPEERALLLRRLSTPSYPPGREWDQPIAQAAREGRFRVESNVDGTAQIICATGFKRGFQHDVLLSNLVSDHHLPTHEQWILVAPESTVSALSDERRTLSLAGAPAQWAFPAADTVAGAKYAARAFLRRVGECRTR
jgi:hypothetical protein